MGRANRHARSSHAAVIARVNEGREVKINVETGEGHGCYFNAIGCVNRFGVSTSVLEKVTITSTLSERHFFKH